MHFKQRGVTTVWLVGTSRVASRLRPIHDRDDKLEACSWERHRAIEAYPTIMGILALREQIRSVSRK